MSGTCCASQEAVSSIAWWFCSQRRRQTQRTAIEQGNLRSFGLEKYEATNAAKVSKGSRARSPSPEEKCE